MSERTELGTAQVSTHRFVDCPAPQPQLIGYFPPMSDISYRTTAEDVASRSLQVTVPLDQLAVAERRAVREYTRQARIPGFRKGHAPEPVIRRRFEQEIRRHVLEGALRDSWDKILKDTDLKPTGDPQVTNVVYEQDQPLVFDLLVEVRPSLTMGTTGGFSLVRTVPPVTDDTVQEQVDRMREQKATWIPVEGTKPRPGQLVSVSVVTIEDGKEPEGGQPYGLVLGKGQAIPDLEELILTLTAGEATEGTVRLPDDHPDASRRGEARRVRVTLHEVKEQQLPAFDDAFAREVGEFDSAPALLAKVREDLLEDSVRSADQSVRDQLVQQLIAANDVPAPPSLTRRLLGAYAQAYKIEAGQMDAFGTSFAPVAEAQVRRELVLDAVATAQKLHATESDMDARIAELAVARGVDPGKLYSSLQQANRLGELERSLTEEKTFAWLLAQSTVTEGSA